MLGLQGLGLGLCWTVRQEVVSLADSFAFSRKVSPIVVDGTAAAGGAAAADTPTVFLAGSAAVISLAAFPSAFPLGRLHAEHAEGN